MSDSKWDALSSIEGALVGFVGAMATIFGWFNSKVKGLHTRIDTVNERVDELQAESAMHRANLMVQEAHHQANLQRLTELKDETKKQTEMLTELYRCRYNQGGNQ